MLAWQGTTASLQDQYAQNWAAMKAKAADKEASLSKKSVQAQSSEEPVDTDGAGTGGTVMQGCDGEGSCRTDSAECIFRTPLQLSDWTVEHVNQWLDYTPLPPEVTAILKANAINGPVLETLSEQDLEALGLDKFGWRRQMLISRKELVDILTTRRRPPECAECFEMSSAIGHSRDNSPGLSSRSVDDSQGQLTPKYTIRSKSPSHKGRVPPSGAGALPSTPGPSPCRHTVSAFGGMRTLVMPPTPATQRLESTARGLAQARLRSPVLPRAGSANHIVGSSFVAIPAATSLMPPTVMRATSVQRTNSPPPKSPRHGSRSVAAPSQPPGSWRSGSPHCIARTLSPGSPLPPAPIAVTPGVSAFCSSPTTPAFWSSPTTPAFCSSPTTRCRGLGGMSTAGSHQAARSQPVLCADGEVRLQAVPFAPPHPPATLLLTSPRMTHHRETLRGTIATPNHGSPKGSQQSRVCGVVVHPPRMVTAQWRKPAYVTPNVPTAGAGFLKEALSRTRTEL